MKSQKINFRYFFIGAMIFMASIQSFAGRDGNGGNGVLIDGKIYSLDLFEAGVEQAPQNTTLVSSTAVADSRIMTFLQAKLNSNYPIGILAAKLTEVYKIDSQLAWHILGAIKMYDWQLLSGHLQNVPDDQDTVLDLPDGQLLQLAVRYKTEIKIDRSYWQQMDQWNQAALIFHEALYALVVPRLRANGIARQVSLDARRVVGVIFSQPIKPYELESLLGSLDTGRDFSEGILPRSGIDSSEPLKLPPTIHMVGEDWFAELIVLYDDGRGSYGFDPEILRTKESKKKFCEDPQWNFIETDIWSVRYNTDFAAIRYYNEEATWYKVKNGWLDWGRSRGPEVVHSPNLQECLDTLNKYELADPLDYLTRF